MISMKKGIFWLLALVLLVVSIQMVSAGVTQAFGINVSTLTINDTRIGCNESTAISMRVMDLFNHSYSPGISTVTVFVDGAMACTADQPSSGDKFDGTWKCIWTEQPNDLKIETIHSVTEIIVAAYYNDPTTGNPMTCDFTPFSEDPNSACKIYGAAGVSGWPANFRFNSTCICKPVQVPGACNLYNVASATWENASGCTDARNYDASLVDCDFCNPGWASFYSSCDFNESGTLLNRAKLKGTAEKNYVSGDNGECCARTASTVGNTIYNHDYGSDCHSPPDFGAKRTCYIDSWLRYGMDDDGDNLNYVPGTEIQNLPPKNPIENASGVRLTTFNSGPQNYTQPLVFDFDGDGALEVMFAKNDTIYSYVLAATTGDFMFDKSQDFPGYLFPSQPATYGISARLNGTYICNGTAPLCTNKVYLVFPTNVSGTFTYLKGFLAGNAVSENATYNVGRNLDWRSGVACLQDSCYIKSVDNHALKVNMETGSVTDLTLSYGGSLGDDNNPKINVPIFFDADADGAQEVIWYGKSSNYNASFICITDLAVTSSQCYADFGIDNVSGVAGTWGYESTDPILYMTGVRDIGGGLIQHNLVKLIYDGAAISATVYNLWQGVESGCISNPVPMRCGSGIDYYDIGVMSFSGTQLSEAIIQDYLGQYNEKELYSSAKNPATHFTTLRADDTFTLTNSLSLTGAGNIRGTPVKIDSDGNGQYEIWFMTSGNNIYVLDEDLNILASKAVTSPPSNTITSAEDVDGDGDVEFVYVNSTSLIAAKLNGSSVQTEYSIASNGKYLMKIVHSDLESKDLYFLRVQGSPYANVSVYTFSNGSFAYYKNVSVGAGSGGSSIQILYVGNIGDNGVFIVSGGTINIGNSTLNSRIEILGIDNVNNNYVDIDSNCCSGASYTNIFAQPIDYFGNGEKEMLVVVKAYDGVHDYAYRIAVLSITGTIVKSISPYSDHYQVYYPVASSFEDEYGGIIYANQFSGYEVGARITSSATNTTRGTGRSTPNLPNACAVALSSQRAAWICYDDAMNRTIYSNAIGFSGRTSSWNEVHTQDGDGNALATLKGMPFIFDITGDSIDDLIIFGADDVIRIYQPGGISAVYSTAKCFDRNNPARVLGSYALRWPDGSPAKTCEIAGVTATSLNGDYWDDIVSGFNGAINLHQSVVDWAPSADTARQWVIPVDLDSNGYVDFLQTSSGVSRGFLSVVGREAVVGSDTLRIDTMDCKNLGQYGDRAYVDVVLGISSPGIEKLYYDIDPGDNSYISGQWISALGDSLNPIIQYSQSGHYIITAYAYYVSAGITTESAKTCEIDVNVTPPGGLAACTLAPDGEFSVTRTLLDNGWSTTDPTTEFISGGRATFTKNVLFTHGFNCDKDKLKVDFKLGSDANGYMDMTIDGVDESGVQITAIKIGIYGGLSDIGGYVVYWKDGVQGTAGGFLMAGAVLSVVIDGLQGKVELYVDDGQIYAINITPGINWDSGMISINTGSQGTVWLDYVKISGTGEVIPPQSGIIKKLESRNIAWSQLSLCVESQPDYPAAPIISIACRARRVKGETKNYCTYGDLNLIYQFNPKCMKELMNYCVDVTYRISEDLGAKSEGINQGTTVCATNIMTQAVYYGVVGPIIGSFWDMFRTNIIPFIIVVVLVLVLFAFFSGKKRGI